MACDCKQTCPMQNCACTGDSTVLGLDASGKVRANWRRRPMRLDLGLELRRGSLVVEGLGLPRTRANQPPLHPVSDASVCAPTRHEGCHQTAPQIN